MSEYCNCEKCQNNGNKIFVNTRNSAVLADFIAYCWAHPTERFWQALRNWSGYGFIEADGRDTFYWEGKDK